MTTLVADVTQGTLTGSGTQDTIGTASSGSSQETYSIFFRNYSVSTVTLKVWVNGTGNQNQIVSASLLTLESAKIDIVLGPSDYVKAEAGASSSIAWTCSKGILTP